jgi:mycothiol system anti-sigma-R factor
MTQHHEPQPGRSHGKASASDVDCRAAAEKLFDFLDGELDDAFVARLEKHVDECKHCFERAEFERRFLELVHAARHEECCPKALRERVLSTLRAEGLGA